MDHSKIAVAIFDNWAREYQDKFMDVSLYGPALDRFCSGIKKEKAAVLDIACGPGNITHYLLNKRPDLEILGIDLAANMLALAKENNPAAEFLLMDARAIGTLTSRYDAIVCGFCLPYLSKKEAVQLIAAAAALLLPGGRLFISTMEDDYGKSGLQTNSKGEQLYMYFHEAGYLTAALRENEFTAIDTERISYPGPGGTTVTDLLLLAERRGVEKQ